LDAFYDNWLVFDTQKLEANNTVEIELKKPETKKPADVGKERQLFSEMANSEFFEVITCIQF
jgi:hypothetical protein